MSFLSRSSKGSPSMQRYRDALAQRAAQNPRSIFADALTRFDRVFGAKAPTASSAASTSTAATSNSGANAPMLSSNDPQSLTDPRMKSNTSKTLLGQ